MRVIKPTTGVMSRWSVALRVSLRCGLLLADLDARRSPANEPANTEQIDDPHPQPIVQAVFGLATHARAMPYRHGNHFGPGALIQRRQEPMHVIEVRQF